METLYKLISSETECDGEIKTFYGIELRGENSYRVESLSTSKQLVNDLVSICNKLKLSQIHIYDVCEDFLVKNY
ncbi:MAG: hypothetical protein IJ424_03750 [Oscillospiraceae bacterium]|nr:hypothetical protein [Oscillospiraceae bacterium]